MITHRVIEQLPRGKLGEIDQGRNIRVTGAEQEHVYADLKLAELHSFVLRSSSSSSTIAQEDGNRGTNKGGQRTSIHDTEGNLDTTNERIDKAVAANILR